MNKVFMLLAKCFGGLASIQLIYVYGYSIYTTAKEDAFIKMMFMILVPPFSQIYLFISRWCEFGFYNTFGKQCCFLVIGTLLALTFMGLAAAAGREWRQTRGGRIVYYLVSAFVVVCLCWFALTLFRTKPCKASCDRVVEVLGVTLGDKVGSGFKLINTSTIYKTYEFYPKQSFRSYDHYVVLAARKDDTVFSVRAQKDFNSEDESEKEAAVLKEVLSAKYHVAFVRTDNGYAAKIGSTPEAGTVIVVATGKDSMNKHIVVFTLMDVALTVKVTKDAGITERNVNESINAL